MLFFKRIRSQKCYSLKEYVLKNVILSVKYNIQNHVNELIDTEYIFLQNNRDSRCESEAQFKSFFSH